ncbi:glycosyltransferase [Blastococcus sp. SYSU D00820]
MSKPGRQRADAESDVRALAPIKVSLSREACGDVWYADRLGVRKVKTSGRMAALHLAWSARPAELLLTHARRKGVLPLLALEAVLRRRRLVLFEFIRPRPKGWRRLVDVVYGMLLRRGVAAVHVLTSFEADDYRKRFRLRPEQIVAVPWPLEMPAAERPTLTVERVPGRVVASGRAACDWATLFRAAELGAWPSLVVVCSANDGPHVERLNRVGAQVLTEIPAEQHNDLVASASVYALVLQEVQASSGHIRLMTAIGARTPVVATRVKALDGYLVPGVTALAVPPNDAEGLAAGVRHLLDDEAAAMTLVERASEAVAGHSMSRYIGELRSALEGLPVAR